MCFLRGIKLSLIKPKVGPGIQRVQVIPKGIWSQEFPSKQYCPTEPSVMTEMFYICALYHSSH